MKRHYNLFINEMISLYLVPKTKKDNQVSTNQLSHAFKPVNQ